MPALTRGIIAFERFMTDWEKVGKQHPLLKPWTDVGIQWATKYYKRMDDTKAYIITMCKSFNWLITVLTTNFAFQSSIPPHVSRGSKTNGKASISGLRRLPF